MSYENLNKFNKKQLIINFIKNECIAHLINNIDKYKDNWFNSNSYNFIINYPKNLNDNDFKLFSEHKFCNNIYTYIIREGFHEGCYIEIVVKKNNLDCKLFFIDNYFINICDECLISKIKCPHSTLIDFLKLFICKCC